MQAFQMTSKMSTMQGVFYPTGDAYFMFPGAEEAEQAARELEAAGFNGQDIKLLTPEVILREIGGIDGESSVALPSVGTEGATVHKYIDLARQGYSAVMVKVANDEDAKRVINSARKVPIAYGQRYHLLAMEDIE